MDVFLFVHLCVCVCVGENVMFFWVCDWRSWVKFNLKVTCFITRLLSFKSNFLHHSVTYWEKWLWRILSRYRKNLCWNNVHPSPISLCRLLAITHILSASKIFILRCIWIKTWYFQCPALPNMCIWSMSVSTYQTFLSDWCLFHCMKTSIFIR